MAIRKLVHLSNYKSKSQCTMYNRNKVQAKIAANDAILDHKATRLRLRYEASIIHILIRHWIGEMLIHRFAATAGKTESQCRCWPWP